MKGERTADYGRWELAVFCPLCGKFHGYPRGAGTVKKYLRGLKWTDSGLCKGCGAWVTFVVKVRRSVTMITSRGWFRFPKIEKFWENKPLRPFGGGKVKIVREKDGS